MIDKLYAMYELKLFMELTLRRMEHVRNRVGTIDDAIEDTSKNLLSQINLIEGLEHERRIQKIRETTDRTDKLMVDAIRRIQKESGADDMIDKIMIDALLHARLLQRGGD